MSEHTTTRDESGSTRRSFSNLSPSVRTIASDAIPTDDRSIPVALCRLGTELRLESDRPHPKSHRSTAPVVDAIRSLEGYVVVRRELLETERYDREAMRDTAVLASDFLHAKAYESIAETPLTRRRLLELYRIATDGSTAISTQFLARVANESAGGVEHDGTPFETLSETAAALGTTAAGTSDETRAAFERYGRELTAACHRHPLSIERSQRVAVEILAGSTSTEPTDGRERVTDDTARLTDDGDRPNGEGDRLAASSSLEQHLASARTSLDRLRELNRSASVSSAQNQPILSRLERATRIPFENVLEIDD
ncbi:hypothetical protein EA462_00540 [Natrarchaeobius halalkaliphilus]|uniref:Uncharacterized protein n=1 Tax=Natrarchaeobius halalkaliphilus TaxID=1679091 RepID=A0A3N6LY39_9EURY|nr:hypothetical protein [Natrarchaeobius halalkaliphilus]RQG92754.1 hypothetical protein EA462_00540 [Natrarchaeobius halalkaliphilus]